MSRWAARRASAEGCNQVKDDGQFRAGARREGPSFLESLHPLRRKCDDFAVSDGGSFFDWLLLGWLASLVVRAFRSISRNRSRASDPDRRNPLLDHVKLLYAGLGVLLTAGIYVGLAGADASQPHSAFVTIPVLVGIALLCIFAVWTLLDLYRLNQHNIRERHYINAPADIRKSLRRIYRSARSVRRGEAYAQGVVGDAELRRLVYSAAQQAVISSELSVQIRELALSRDPEDRRVIAEAEEHLAVIRKQIKDLEARFGRTADTADKLSQEITRPQRERVEAQRQAQADAAQAERHHIARVRLTEATYKAKLQRTAGDDGTDLEDRVSGLHEGYQEAARISATAQYGPSLSAREDETADRTRTAGHRAKEVARAAASRGAKIASTAARLGVEKLRNGLGDGKR